MDINIQKIIIGLLMSALKKELEVTLPEIEDLILEKSEEIVGIVLAWAKEKLGLVDSSKPEEKKDDNRSS